MSTWERLAGNTDRFAVRLSFEPDPDKDVFEDPAYGGSWGTLQIWVDGLNLCAHHAAGESSDESLDSVHWYLLPLLEWVAQQWDPLLHEERLPLRNRAATAAHAMTLEPALPLGADPERYYGDLDIWQTWWRHHALEAAADGGLFPRVFLRRWGDQIEVSWKSTGLVGAPDDFRFSAPVGVGRHSVAEVAEALYAVVTDAAKELTARHPSSARIAVLKETLEAIPQEDRTHARVELLTGLSSSRFRTIWSEARTALTSLGDRIQEQLLQPTVDRLAITASPHLAVLFGSVSPDISTDDVLTLTRIVVDAYQETDTEKRWELPELNDILDDVEASALPDYEQGNRLADGVLQGLGIDDDELIDIEALLTSFDVRIGRVVLGDEGVRGLSITGPGHRPACFTNPNYHDGETEQVRRFTLAHEFCHLLFDRQRAVKLAVLSGPWAPRDIERRANAFAAALLMPRALLDIAAINASSPPGTAEWIYEIATVANTSGTATLERLANLGLLDEAQREVLRDTLRVDRA